MPKGPVPLKYIDLLEGNVLAHLATLDADGCPNVNPIWVLWEGERIHFSVLDETRKLANIRERPQIALSFLDPEDNGRYLEVRGRVTEIKRYDDLSFVNLVARKYTGSDYKGGKPGQVRHRVTLTVESWTGQG